MVHEEIGGVGRVVSQRSVEERSMFGIDRSFGVTPARRVVAVELGFVEQLLADDQQRDIRTGGRKCRMKHAMGR